LFTVPGVFGLHPNAEITYFNNSVKSLWLNIIDMATSSGGGAGGIDREATILEIANNILDKTIPEVFDEYNIRKSFNNAVGPT
jgi:dynein heavy chain